MPTQLQLEGPELEPLLARVRAEHGPGARIVQAEKVRTGGVGGFFAKQHFEIVVELDEAAPPARPTSLLDLADEVSDAERSTVTVGPASASTAAPASVGAAAVSTESVGFAAVLARLGAAAGEEPPAGHAAAPPVAPAAVIPAQRRPAEPARSVQPARPAPARRSPAAAPRRAAAAKRPGTAVAVRRAAVVAKPAPAAAATSVRTVRATPSSRAGAQVAVRPPAAVAPRRVADARPAASVARSSGALSAATRAVPAAVLDEHEQLSALGLPAHLLPTGAGRTLHARLVEQLKALPKAPRPASRAGSVLAIVGPLPLAREVARQMADELGLPRTSVVQAGAAADARRRRATWGKRAHSTLVVVDTPLTAVGALRTRALLDALEPTGTWAVVEATRKPRDVGAWATAVGRVDALALTAVDETSDPAAVLELGIPVGRLGTRTATPAAWATLLTDRVAA